MTIILFLIDTSASMGQRTYLGTSLLDSARYAVEYFLKNRSKDPNSRNDRYMLLTFEEFPKNIKVGWRENQAVLADQLRKLRARGLTNIGAALADTFRILHLNRAASGVDQFGHGRYPYFLEPATIICISDGGKVTTNDGLSNQVSISSSTTLCSDLYQEPFRWDQRLFSLILRLPAHQPLGPNNPLAPVPVPPVDTGPLEAMCAATAGRSYAVCTPRQIYAAMDSIVARLHNVGVTLWLERAGPPPAVQQDSHVANGAKSEPLVNGVVDKSANAETGAGGENGLIKHMGKTDAQPPRTSHPVLRYKCDECTQHTFTDFPFDKYELEPSTLTQFILARKQPNVCWQLFVAGSSRYEGLGSPFGYLKASATMNAVTVYIMPYNYPVLLALLSELRDTLKMKVTSHWRKRFDNYVSNTLPVYYYVPLRKALSRLNLHNLMDPFKQDVPNSLRVQNELLRATQLAKGEIESLQRELSERLQIEQQREQNDDDSWADLRRTTVDKQSSLYSANTDRPAVGAGAQTSGEQAHCDFTGLRLRMRPPTVQTSKTIQNSAVAGNLAASQQPKWYTNAFDVRRDQLLECLGKMRLNLKQECNPDQTPMLHAGIGKMLLCDAEELHSLPISRMGLYQDYLKRLNETGRGALRPVEGTTAARLHGEFGNPYKVDKRNTMFVDEADIDKDPLVENAAGGSAGANASVGGAKTTPGTAHRKGSLGADGKRMPAPRGMLRRKRGPLPKNFRWQPRFLSTTEGKKSTESTWETQSDVLPAVDGPSVSTSPVVNYDSANDASFDSDDDRLSIASAPPIQNGASERVSGSDGHFPDADVKAPIVDGRLSEPSSSGEKFAPKGVDVDGKAGSNLPENSLSEKLEDILKSVRRPGRGGRVKAALSKLSTLPAGARDRDALVRRVAKDARRLKRAKFADDIGSNALQNGPPAQKLTKR